VNAARPLCDTVAEALSQAAPPWPALDLRTVLRTADGPTRAVVVLDRWSPAQAESLSAAALGDGRFLLPVRLDGATALIGPVLHRAAPVCLGCAEAERLATIGGRTPRREPELLLGGVPCPAALPLMAELAAAALADPARHDGLVWAIRTDEGTCSTHRPRPRPGGCRRCAPPAADTPAAARLVIPPPQPGPRRWRAPNPACTAAGLRAALHDWRFGPVAHVSRREQFPVALAHAEVVGPWPTRDGGYGRAVTFADAERVALLEAVERMAGLGPRGKTTVLQASLAELGEQALDPRRLGGHEPGAITPGTSRLVLFDTSTVLPWVWGWSLGTGRAVAVPAQVAYWGHPLTAGRDAGPQIMRESSNGCAVGNTLAEAVLYGLLEVAERDAFLMAWYARTPLARILPPQDDMLVGCLCDKADALGYDVLLFDATNDFGVPAVVALLLCRASASAAPQAFFAASAHPDPCSAIRSAVLEAAVNLMISVDLARVDPRLYDRDRLRALLADPHLVVTPDDHVALYSLPEARPRLDFLTSAGLPRPWRACWPGLPASTPDLGEFLDALVGRVAAAGMDVIVVDQTDPLIRDRLGLYAAKVVVPGAIPLVFGHTYRRTRGLPRLLEVPWRLGRLPARPDYAALPLDPHPFP
jgi:ribosomal protein S12 methylthiotransferase accessory factor